MPEQNPPQPRPRQSPRLLQEPERKPAADQVFFEDASGFPLAFTSKGFQPAELPVLYRGSIPLSGYVKGDVLVDQDGVAWEIMSRQFNPTLSKITPMRVIYTLDRKLSPEELAALDSK